MAEVVLGVGVQKSLRKIALIAEENVRKTYGVPRLVRFRSKMLKVTAEREEFDGEFLRFKVKIDQKNPAAQDLQSAAEGLGEGCDHTREDGSFIFTCPPESSDDVEAGAKAVDALVHAIKLPEIWHIEGGKFRDESLSLELLFKAMVQYKASDLHLSPGQPAIFRIDNMARTSEVVGVVSSQQIQDLLKELAPATDWADFEKDHQCSFAIHQKGIGYGRASAFVKSGATHLTFRFLPEKIPSFADLGVPQQTMVELASLHSGLLLVAGMTGSGKTTTCAAIVDWINSNKMVHILTIEDPVEYVHSNKKAFVSQRSLGGDVLSFGAGVEGALRHDPDVIVIGEMIDADTIRAAINAASTGHLVISTIHSGDACGVVNRIVSFFDPVERDLIRMQLRDSLACVICQKLVPKIKGGRVPGLEILFNDIKPIASAIVQGNTLGIRIGMQQTLSHSVLFELYLHQLYVDEVISLQEAQDASPELSLFEQIRMGTYTVPRLEGMI